MEFYNNDILERTRYYIGNYEKIELANGDVTELHYIAGGDGLAAIYVAVTPPSGEPEGATYYTYTDYQGSILALTNTDGVKVFEQNFDAWGRKRNVNDWTYDATEIDAQPFIHPDYVEADFAWLTRGYTGHEHLTEFGLINMNGRMYDPVTARMLSPDNFVQSPFNTQSYNRYSYVINNPLKYTDPSGELFFVIPSIGFSPQGGLDVSVTAGFGIPGILSAQGTLGYSFGSNNTYASIGGTVAGLTGSVGYGTQTGVTAGLNFNVFPLSQTQGFGTNLTSIGVNYSQNGGFSANSFGVSYSENGISFNPSVSYSHTFVVRNTSYKVKEQVYFYDYEEGLINEFGEDVYNNVELSSDKVYRAYNEYGHTENTIPFELGKESSSPSKVIIDKKMIRQHWRGKTIEGRNTIYHEFKHASDNYDGSTTRMINTFGITKGYDVYEYNAYNYTLKLFGPSGLNGIDRVNFNNLKNRLIR